METAEFRKFTLISFIVFGSLCGLVFFKAATAVVDLMKWGGNNFLFGYSWTVVGIALSSVVGLIVAIVLANHTKATTFFDDVFAELFKTTWPTAEETTRSTIAVTLMVAAAAGIFFAIDSVWSFLFKWLL